MRGVLFVGNFLPAAHHRQYCEDLADRVERDHWQVSRTVGRVGRVGRLADMLRIAWTERHRYEVAHVDVYSGAAFVWAELVCFELRRLGKPYVLTLHGGNLPTFAQKWPRRVRALLRSAAVVTAPSRYLQDGLAACAPNTVLLPNAIEAARCPFQLRRRPAPRLVWLRAFHQIYNPTLAIETLAQVLRDYPDARLVMRGDDRGDGARAATEQRARDLGVSDHVEIGPRIPKADVGAFLATGDIFLNTTDVDNTPVTVLEAMACGLCVVSTDVGGIPHLVEHGRDGLLVPPRDPTAMARAVGRILAEPDLAGTLSASAHARALACDWSTVTAQWTQLFTRVIATNASP